LRDDLTKDEEAVIVDFIMKGCELNIFFAHRVWFNLKASLINKDNQTQVMKILSLLSELEVLVLKSQEKLYIANSDALVKLITKTNLDNMLSPECLLMQQQEELESQNGKASGDEQQSKYSANYFMSLFSNPKSGGSSSRSNIALRSIGGKDQQALMTESRYQNMDYDEENQRLVRNENLSQIYDKFSFTFSPYKKTIPSLPTAAKIKSTPNEYRQQAFFSTPHLIHDLTDISVKIL
jgi:hypothetical protein